MADLETGDCGVCIGTDDCELTEFWSSNIVTSRKDYKCCECRLPILKGQQYERSAGKSDGHMWSYKPAFFAKK
jgi:hypothetical protein